MEWLELSHVTTSSTETSMIQVRAVVGTYDLAFCEFSLYIPVRYLAVALASNVWLIKNMIN